MSPCFSVPTKKRPARITENVFTEPESQPSKTDFDVQLTPNLPQALLLRDEVTDRYIRGFLVTQSQRFQILERPWLGNLRNQSCIPAGRYYAKFLPKSASGKYKRCYHLTPVDGRSGILIHNGNLVEHTRGCLIIGKRRGTLRGQAAVLNSKTALTMLVSSMNASDFILTISGQQH